jgi:uncharacterized BrkB/YihY/UPF0761 family membrane protein
MDITEYWITLVSIVVGLAVTDLLANFYKLIHKRERVEWDALPLVWAGVTLLFIFNYWWGAAKNEDGSQSASVVGHYVLLAVAPVLLFLMAASVLPRDLPSDGLISMREEWERSRRSFFIFLLLLVMFAWLNITVISGTFVWDLAAYLRSVLLIALVAALFVRSRLVEWIAALFVMSIAIFTISVQSVR